MNDTIAVPWTSESEQAVRESVEWLRSFKIVLPSTAQLMHEIDTRVAEIYGPVTYPTWEDVIAGVAANQAALDAAEEEPEGEPEVIEGEIVQRSLQTGQAAATALSVVDLIKH